jgi:hypothetical protein
MVGSMLVPENAHKIMDVVEKFDIDYQLLLLRQSLRKSPKLLSHDRIKEWRKRNAKELADS